MERKIVRQYENFDTVIPQIDEFPILNQMEEINNTQSPEVKTINSVLDFKIDDLILIGLMVILLMEQEKNIPALIALGILFISDYIN